MIKNLLFIIFTFSSFSAFCQDKQLLENYQFRVNNFKALDMFFGTGGVSNNNYQGYGGSRAIGGGIGANIIAIKSTDKVFRTMQANISGNFSFSTENSNTRTNKSRQLYFSPNVDVNNKWYAANNFFELGSNIKVSSSAEDNKNTKGNLVSNNFSDNNVDVNFTIGIGNGRLEIVTDLQNAFWLTKVQIGRAHV